MGIFPYPVLERLLDHLLLALCDGGFLFVQHRSLFAVVIIDIIKDSHILEIQRFFDDFIAVDPICTVGVCCLNIATVIVFLRHIPLTGERCVSDLDLPLGIPGCAEQLIHKLLHHIGRKPCSTQPDGNFAGREILGLYLFQCFHIRLILRVFRQQLSCKRQLFADVTGKILVCRQIFGTAKGCGRIQENDASQITIKLLLGFAGELLHVGDVDFCLFSQ